MDKSLLYNCFQGSKLLPAAKNRTSSLRKHLGEDTVEGYTNLQLVVDAGLLCGTERKVWEMSYTYTADVSEHFGKCGLIILLYIKSKTKVKGN